MASAKKPAAKKAAKPVNKSYVVVRGIRIDGVKMPVNSEVTLTAEQAKPYLASGAIK